MNKKTIISNTILFIGIVAFVLVFSNVFGQQNMLIGISTVTAMLMLLERDLTAQPVMNTIKLTGFNVFMGIAAFLAGLNLWLAVPVNFIAMFVISYSLIFNLKNPLYLPFSLQYLFLLAMPVGIGDMPLRIAALVFGALSIMGLQVLFNRNRVAKSGNKLIQAIFDGLVGKVEAVQRGESGAESGARVKGSISSLRSMIYDKREEDYYLTEEGRTKLNLSAALEKINLMLDSVPAKGVNDRILDDLHACLQLGAASLDPNQKIEELRQGYSQVLGKYKGMEEVPLFVLRVLSNLDFLFDSLNEAKLLGQEHGKIVRKLGEVPLKFKKMTYGNGPKHTTSIKFSYALRVALGITIGAFLMDFFELKEGRWMLFTILSVGIPIYEQSQQKMRDRLFATIVGGLLAAFMFTIFESNTSRSILLLLGGYLMSYIKVYRYSTILVTFSAIGSVVLVTGETHFLTLERLLMVGAGVVIALVINCFVLPYKQENAMRDLEAMYKDTICTMLEELDVKSRGETRNDSHSMKNLLIITTMIEDRLKLNAGKEAESIYKDWLDNLRLLASSIFEMYLWLDKYGVDTSKNTNIRNSIQALKIDDRINLTHPDMVETIKGQIEATPDIENRIALSMIFDIETSLAALQSEEPNLTISKV